MEVDTDSIMAKSPTHRQLVLQLAREDPILTARTAREAGVPYATLSRMVRDGELVRVSRGLYELPDVEVSEHHTLAEVALRAPRGVICLLSALAFHELTTELPFEVWLAYERGTRPPAIDTPQVRLFRLSGRSYNHGVQTYDIEGVEVRVYSPAKTVADCFKFRSTVGLDVAIESLRDYLRHRAGSIDDLWLAAKACRVHEVIRPYMDALA